MIPFRLLVFCLLCAATMFATGCAGKSGAVKPQGLTDSMPAADQAQAQAPVSRVETQSNEP
ncbi:MAG: hypothetical protein HOP32_11970, partial [Nitrospira sp.]|nr:hypothetical protein [Nitrospira sp.]